MNCGLYDFIDRHGRAGKLRLAAVCLGLFSISCGGSPQARTGNPTPAKAERPAVVWSDSDNDGVPDAYEISSFDDRTNFRRWFANIAEMQFYKSSDSWNTDQRDCAGLVRFAMREALRRHDRQWFQAMGEGYEAIAPDVHWFGQSQKIFRTDFGSFEPSDLENKFSEFADARTLKNHNVIFVSRDRRRAQPADLLFFHQPWVQKFPYHIMIFIGEARHASEGVGDWVVYHTGSSPDDGGEMKKVRLSVLDHHPDKRWRPVESNQNFLGFYRLKILE